MLTKIKFIFAGLLYRLCPRLFPSRKEIDSYFELVVAAWEAADEERRRRLQLQAAHKKSHELFRLAEKENAALRKEVAGCKVSIISQAAMLAHPESVAAALAETITQQQKTIADQAKTIIGKDAVIETLGESLRKVYQNGLEEAHVIASQAETIKNQGELIKWLWTRMPGPTGYDT